MIGNIIAQQDRIEELETQLKTMIDQQVAENMVRVAEPMLSDALAAADKRIEELEKACKECSEVSQSNYQMAKAAEAKLTKVVDALSAFQDFENSVFYGIYQEKNKRAAYRGVKRKLLAALKSLEEKP